MVRYSIACRWATNLTASRHPLTRASSREVTCVAGAMAQYQELYSLDGGREDGPHAPELEALLTQIENLHKTVEAEAGE